MKSLIMLVREYRELKERSAIVIPILEGEALKKRKRLLEKQFLELKKQRKWKKDLMNEMW